MNANTVRRMLKGREGEHIVVDVICPNGSYEIIEGTYQEYHKATSFMNPSIRVNDEWIACKYIEDIH